VTGHTDLRAVDRKPQPAGVPACGQRVPALMYHEITTEPLLSSRLAVSPDALAQQIGYLAGGRYTALRAADLARLRQHGEALPARPVLLTFDDGFADVHDRALPLLAGHGVTATLYVTTGWIRGGKGPSAPGGQPATSLPDTGMLSWSQIGEIAAAGIEIGAHTRTHPHLDRLGPRALRGELISSKHELEDRLGRAVTGLSYPFGYSSRRVRAAAHAAGYSYALAVGNRLIRGADDQFALPRLTMGRSTGLPDFARILRAGRLPAEYAVYRALTAGWSVVRRTRSAVNWPAQQRNDGE
jgi:peptidoglycan/xylan/chitin deacetylase (PgdA/CDA1 family)